MFKLWLEEDQKQFPIVDTNNPTNLDQYRLGNAGVIENGEILGWHITDNPNKILEVINGNKKLTATYGASRGRYSELGPGLYISAVPHMWEVRSSNKWDFIKDLTDKQRSILANYVRNHKNMTEKGYLSTNEKERMLKDIDNFEKDPRHDYALQFAQGQPYNIQISKPEVLQSLGINPGTQPTTLEFKLKGRFVDLSDDHRFPVIVKFIKDGFDGAFIKGGFSGDPQICIWKKESIIDVRPINRQIN